MNAQRKMGALAAAIAASCLTSFSAVSPAAEPTTTSPGVTPEAKPEQAPQYAYLGIAVQPLIPALVSHLPRSFRDGQGILVVRVAKNSAADTGGLRVDDILMTYGDQKLFAPRQLVGLVRQDKPGHDVTLGIVRAGKPMTVKVTLSAHQFPPFGSPYGSPGPGYPERPAPGWIGSSWQPPHPLATVPAPPSATGALPVPPSAASDWKNFDSMTIKKLGDGRFHAEIHYRSANGTLDHKTFEGTREEIRKAILSQKGLPAAEVDPLLRSLDLPMG